jgi:hypothetical protein
MENRLIIFKDARQATFIDFSTFFVSRKFIHFLLLNLENTLTVSEKSRPPGLHQPSSGYTKN